MTIPRPRASRNATLKDVAATAGVHRSTASRALDPATSHKISPDVVARVVKVAETLNYRRDLSAAGLRNNRTGLIGMLVPDIANPVFAPILAGAQTALAEAGYAVLVANAPDGDAGLLALVQGLWSRRTEGLIIATSHDGDPVIPLCLREGRPAVLVNRTDCLERLPAATSNDREAMRLAVRHLAALGHRQIAHLGGPADISTGRLRAEGFESAIGIEGLRPAAMFAARAYTREAGEAGAASLLDIGGFTAIVTANDLLALGAYQELGRRGLTCPGDISITGHNDMALMDMVQPRLTTIRIDLGQMGRDAAGLLLERIRDPAALVRHIFSEPELVIRASTAPPKPAA